MIIRICAFTDKGFELVNRIESALPNHLFEMRTKDEDLKAWVKEGFLLHTPIVFVGAAGIATRHVAPFVEDKLLDSPVLVIDEKGQFVIPILSGHVGGGNALARELSKALCATAVITTATDVNNLFSIDVFAVNNGLLIENRDGIRAVSSKLLKEGSISIAVDKGIDIRKEEFPGEIRFVDFDSKEADVSVSLDTEYRGASLLKLKAKPYVMGIGCKKAKPFEEIKDFVFSGLKENGIDICDVAFLSSIDIKSKERGLLLLSSSFHIPVMFFSSDELNAVSGEFSESEFVQSVTGVANVCERAAMAAAGEGAKLIVKKQANNGVTMAVSKRKVVLHG